VFSRSGEYLKTPIERGTWTMTCIRTGAPPKESSRLGRPRHPRRRRLQGVLLSKSHHVVFSRPLASNLLVAVPRRYLLLSLSLLSLLISLPLSISLAFAPLRSYSLSLARVLAPFPSLSFCLCLSLARFLSLSLSLSFLSRFLARAHSHTHTRVLARACALSISRLLAYCLHFLTGGKP